jgi:S1-C subfamily serine protease
MVELISGDRLPGLVVGFRRDADSTGDATRPYFQVRPSVEVDLAGSPQRETVRVVERFVRRVMWQPRESGGTDYKPGVAFFRNGKSVRFRGVRFGDDYAQLLVDGRTQRATFEVLAEIHLPSQNPWEAYYDELSVLNPNSESRLFRAETSTGLVATTSNSRLAAGGSNIDDAWYALAPAWCLDTLWISQRSIGIRQMFAPHQVPLSRFLPSQVTALGRVATWRVNRNAYGGPLVSGGLDHGWGFGVHSVSRLHLPLPTIARSFRVGVGLDAQVGIGGCARARIRIDEKDSQPLYESPLILGTQDSFFDCGSILLPAADDSPRTLILEIDPVHKGRPEGADPFNIRDVINWVEPSLELDSSQLRTEVRRRIGRQVLAWDKWELNLDPAGVYTLENVLGGGVAPAQKRFRPAVRVHNVPLKLTRDVEINSKNRWLVIFAHRNPAEPKNTPTAGSPAEIEIRVDGELVGNVPVPVWLDVDPTPLMVDLSRYVGRKVNVQITQTARPTLPPVQWKAISFEPRPPAWYELFEDVGEFVSVDANLSGRVTTSKERPFTGIRAAKVPAGGFFTLKLEDSIRVRENPRWGEHRYLRFAVRKPKGGQVSLELQHDGADGTSVRYEAGLRKSDDAAQDFVWFDDELPANAVPDGSEGAESWQWVSGDGNPVAFGKMSIRRQSKEFGQHYFTAAKPPLQINSGDKLFAYVYLDPKDPPRQILLEWNSGQWMHRAYWGENLVNHGFDGSTSRIYMGPLPKAGEWVRLEVDTSRVGLPPGTLLNGYSMSQYGGTTWWDKSGVRTYGTPSHGIAKQSWPTGLPDDWIVITRDLFADFGKLNVTGLKLHVPDGDHALFDHIYLAKNRESFSSTGAPDADLTNANALRPLYRQAFDEGVSATVRIEIGGRHGSGVLVGDAGHVLTAAHFLVGEKKEATVTLKDGTSFSATTLGICRDLDVGLLAVAGEIPVKGLAWPENGDVEFGPFYVMVSHPNQDDRQPHPEFVTIGGWYAHAAWTNTRRLATPAGGPLLDRDGRLLGIRIRPTTYSNFGGFYTRSEVIRQQWERLKKGEVWGRWYRATGPMIGVIITSAGAGATITKVSLNSPAAAAGIQVGDVIKKIDGQPVGNLEDVYTQLADNDPGQMVAFELKRGDAMIPVTLSLIHRNFELSAIK